MKKVIRIAIVTIICAAIMVGYYYYLNHSFNQSQEEDTTAQTASEKDKVLEADMAKNYPETPREVIKWYNRILALLYGEDDLSSDEIEKLCDQIRTMMDDDLKKVNPRDDYISAVKSDIKGYKARKARIISTDVSDTDDVEYKTLNGDKMAYVVGTYLVREDSGYSRTYQQYALRRDHNGNYKIVAFRQVDDPSGDTGSSDSD